LSTSTTDEPSETEKAPATAADGGSLDRGALSRRRRTGQRLREGGIQVVLLLSALVSIATTAAIVLVLVVEASSFFEQVPVTEFLFGTRWAPLLEPRSFGVLPLVCGTVLVVVGSSLISIPVGLLSAIYLSEYAGSRLRGVVKPVLEILAGIPTVVYGYFALTFVTPVIQFLLPQTQVFNAASASVVVGIMTLPMIASLCDDALRAVPRSLREGAYALGATQLEVSARVVVPAALSGILAAFVLAVSRAIGETMAVTLAAGATPKLTLNPLESIQTITAYIVQVSLGDTPAGTVEYQTIFAVGALLFAITLVMNLGAHRILRRFLEVYE